MSALSLAREYLDIFYKRHEWDDLKQIFHDNLSFAGPLYSFETAQEYIDSLKNDPPIDCSYKVLYEFENVNSATIIYEFSKAGTSVVMMSQTFEIEDNLIKKIFLVFDTFPFRC